MEVHGFEKLRFSLSLFVNIGETCVSDRSYFCVAYSRTMASSDLFIYLFVHESTRVSHVVFNMSQGALV